MQNVLHCPLGINRDNTLLGVSGKAFPESELGLRLDYGHWALAFIPDNGQMWPDTWHTPAAIPSQKWQAVLKLWDRINPAFLKMLLWDGFVRVTQILSCTMWLFTLARSAHTWSKSPLQKGAFPDVVPASLGSSKNWKQKKSDDWRDSNRQ